MKKLVLIKAVFILKARKTFAFLLPVFYLCYLSTIHNVCAQGIWTQKASHAGGGRYAIVGFSIGAKGYIGTGLTSVSTKGFWEWDQATDVWIQKADFGGSARYYAAAFVIGSKAYIGTGWDGSIRQDFWEWDQATNIWTQRTDFGGGPRMRVRGFSIGNKGYFTTGNDVAGTNLMDLWEYDPNLNPPMGTWTAKASLPNNAPARRYATAFSICDKGYLACGQLASVGSSQTSLNDFWEYDPVIDLWTQKASFPGIPSNQTVGFGIDTKGYMGVGRSAYNGTFLTQFFEYDQGTDTWATMANFAGSARAYSMGFSICNKGYVGTGYTPGGGPMADFWEFTSPSNNPPTIQTNPTCNESSDATVTVYPTCGAPPYTYSWNTVPVQTTATAIGLGVGNYTVNIIDSKWCSSTAIVNIIPANPSPVSNFIFSIVCLGQSTVFTDQSTVSSGSVVSRTWGFGDGSAVNTTSNPTHVYANAGSYTVSLIVTTNNGCADTITKPVQVYYNPIAGFSHSDVCFKDSMHFTNTSLVDPSTSIASYSWTFGDGSPNSGLKNPAHFYSTAGTFNVSLLTTTIDGCSDTATAIVKVYDPPTSAFTFSNTCLLDSAIITNSSLNPLVGSIANWSWNFGDGSALNTTTWNPRHLYAAPGNYSITLITYSTNLACPDTLMNPITVFPMPVANFGFTPICLNQPMNFTDSSTVSSGSIASRSWNFGDGGALNITQNPAHIYASPGTYTVSLIVTTNNGCKDTIAKSVVVHPLPVAQFSTVNVCDNNKAQFTDLSSIPASDILQSWTWNFGDGSPLNTNQSIIGGYLYANPGSYNVQLLVVSNFGCFDFITKIIIVHPNPVANFNNTSVCNGNATQFTNSSTIASGSISTWSWNFGDGSPLNITQNPSHLYASAGIYQVTLITHSTNFGCADTLTKSVQVYYNPIASFTYSNVCFKDSMFFTNTSYVDTSTSIASYLWVFGDGSATSILQNPVHYYSNAGTYNVTLVTTTADFCTDATNNSVKVFDPPSSAFTFNNTCLLDSAVFTNVSTNPLVVTGSIASWSWNFGDGSPLNSTTWSPRHLYATPGNYPITLITHSSNLGCPDTLQDSITVFPMPLANFGFTDVCLNQAMNFQDSSTVSSGAVTSWSWSFGDGSPLNILPNPSHTYTNPGIYIVTVIAATNNGCKDTIAKSVVAHPLPVAQYSTTNVCNGTIVQFTDLSSILPSDTIQSWKWNFGDASPFSTNANTSHLFAGQGSYPVKLWIISNFGCADSITKISVVNPNPTVSFIGSDTVGCEPLCISFLNASTLLTGSNIKWAWNLGDGSTINNSQSFDHCYTNDSVFAPNSFNVTLTVTSDSGCVRALSKNNYITVYPNPNAGFTVLPQTTTITDPVISFTDLSVGANFWNWNFGDGFGISSVFNPPPQTFADTGTYLITLMVSTQYGCIDTVYENVIIEMDFVFYIPNAFTPNDDGINDFFSGKGIFLGNYEMAIFDRWGNLVFFSDDYNKPWDGKANHGDALAQMDVYVYTIKLTDFKRKKHTYKGIVTLVR